MTRTLPAPSRTVPPRADGGDRRRLRTILSQFLGGRLIGWLLVAVLLAFWEVSTANGWLDTPNVPPLRDVVAELLDQISQNGPLVSSISHTLRLVFLGYLVGVSLGIAIGSLMGSINFLHNLLEPVTELIRPIPATAIVPLLVLFLGIGEELNIFLIAKATMFPVLLNTYAGIRGVPETLTDTGRTFGLSGIGFLRTIGFPYAVPSVVVGARIALAGALVVAVLTEMVAGNSGIGYYLMTSQQTLSVTNLYAGVIVVAAIGYLMNLTFNTIESRLLKWHVSNSARAQG